MQAWQDACSSLNECPLAFALQRPTSASYPARTGGAGTSFFFSFFLFLFLTCSTLRHQIANHNLNTVRKVTAMIDGVGVSCVRRVDLTTGEERLDELHKGLSKFRKECTLHMPR